MGISLTFRDPFPASPSVESDADRAVAPGMALEIFSSSLIIIQLLPRPHMATGLDSKSSGEEDGWGHGSVGVSVGEGHLSSVASRETPQHMCPPGMLGDGAPRGWPAACSQASPPARIDVVCESGLFSLGCGGDYSEKIGLELLGLNSEISHFPSLLTFSFHFGKADSSSGKLPRSKKGGQAYKGGALPQRRKTKAKLAAFQGRPSFGVFVPLLPLLPSSC